MNYEVKSSYQVFVLADTNAIALNGRVYGLNKATNNDFASERDALEWIQNEGQRQLDYTVIEIYRKA
jgi:hypothetical protein